ncbi:MAG: sugar phosphate nucleotidyltransferase [Pseudomonadota bacterium]
MSNSRWSIVLAGGQGERMAAAIEQWLGERRPKQFCAFSQGLTMLEHTFLRARGVVAAEQIVTVIGRDHRRYVEELGSEIPGVVLEQPHRAGTAAGLLLPLSWVMARDPDAVVCVLPSDHFVNPPGQFRKLLDYAMTLAARTPEALFLFGAQPTHPECDYGWIASAPREDRWESLARPVVSFHEKPTEQFALQYFDAGYLWNTFIIAAKASAIWRAATSTVPEVIGRLDPVVSELSRLDVTPTDVHHAVNDAYRTMPELDFSRDVIEKFDGPVGVIPLYDVEWNDWGRPERIVESLAKTGEILALEMTGHARAG